MLNFNNAGEQREGGSNGPIPPKSIVKVKITVREPSEKKRSTIHPALTVSAANNSNHYLACEFVVASGTYAGVKIWQNFIVSGSEKAVNISMAFLKAALEAVRGIKPTDSTPAATAARQLNDWRDFNGMELPVMVGIKKPAAGDQYINNEIMRAVTPDKPEYQQVMAGGEMISNLPIPETPQSAQSAKAEPWGTPATQPNQPAAQPPAWGQAPPQTAQPGQSTPPPANKPAWA